MHLSDVTTGNGDHLVNPEDVHYRVVKDEELALLTPLFTRLGWPAPDPAAPIP